MEGLITMSKTTDKRDMTSSITNSMKKLKKCKHTSWRGGIQPSEGGGLYIYCNGCNLAEIVKKPKAVRYIYV